jgi:hypothetical protein
MGDLRNKIRKEEETECIRRMQARNRSPQGPPFTPVCAGCGLKGLHNLAPSGEYIQVFEVTGGRFEKPAFYCETCVKPFQEGDGDGK